MDKRLFGKLPNGEDVYIYRLTDGTATAEIMEYGAAIVSLCPFGDVDVVGGFDTLEAYTQDTSNQGAIVGRVANRIENARFEIDGKVYLLVDNDNGNCLHGGVGFQHRLWKVVDYTENSITLSYLSPDGEDGFPANLQIDVSYTLKDAAIIISYRATPDGKTPIALTNHAFFNLDGFGGDIKEHTVQIWADSYSEVNDKLIPTGNHPNVIGTPLDLRLPKKVGEDLSPTFDGYDHNMILFPKFHKEFNNKKIGLAARVENKKMIMQVYTDQPGLQFYTGNFLGNGPDFKGNIPQIRQGALCLEAQTEPNCINHGEGIYEKGQVYKQLTVYEFIAK